MTPPPPSEPLPGSQRLRLIAAALLWLALNRVLSDHGARLLPDVVRRALTLDTYLASMLVLSTALGLALWNLLSPAPRALLGLAAPPRGVLGSVLVAPFVFVAALALGIYVALPTLLAEFARGGAEVSRQNLGEFGRVVRQSPLIVTVLWVVVIAPVGEELLFRGALWGALRELGRRADRPAGDDPLAGLVQQGAAERAGRGLARWMAEGGLATLITTAIFGAMHLGTPGGAGIILVTSSLLLGFGLGLARQHSGALWAPMALHAVYNGLGLGHARNWFVSEAWPKDYGVPRLLTVVGLVGLAAAIGLALWRWRAGRVAAAAAALGLLAPRAAWAGGVVGEGAQRRVEQESVLVVWDHERKVEHLLVAARASGLTGAGAHLFALPQEASVDRPLDGIGESIARLLPNAAPLPSVVGEAPALAPRPDGLAALCKTWKLTCQASPLSWSAITLARQDVALVPFVRAESGPSTSPYAHLRFDASHAFVPFSEPIDDAQPEPEPPLPSADHPPRVRIWLELFNESRAGRWERQMDDAAAARSDDLAACYAKVLEQRRRLAGDVHVQLRVGVDHVVSDEEERASSKPLEPVARCFASALARAAWPRNQFGKPIRFEAHASLRPPAAVTRRMLAVVLSTQDVEPRLGDADEPRVVPDLRRLASLEPEPAALRAAFDETTRRSLGLDLSRRYRLVAFETGADPHALHDDIALRPLALAAPRPGETPLPIVARGDQRTLPTTPPPVRWWRTRRARLGGLALLLALLIALVIWRDR